MKSTEYYQMINEEINKLLDMKNERQDRTEQYLIHKCIQSLVKLRVNFVQFIECEGKGEGRP